MKTTKLFASLAALAVVATTAAPAFASVNQWEKNHPRRAEVNQRLANQNRRIHEKVKDGEMTKQQATALHQEDRQIRHEERQMASLNGGHITKAEQKALNQQETAVSKQIGK